MKYHLIVVVFIMALFISCKGNKKNITNDTIDTITSYDVIDEYHKTEQDVETSHKDYVFDDITQARYDLQKVMYVTNVNGLEERFSPSVDSKILRSYLYCERIIVFDRSNEAVTIDGITDYWYKVVSNSSYIEDVFRYSFVFGGHLSEQLPLDAPKTILNGYWTGDPLHNEAMSYEFSGNTFTLWEWHGEYECKGTFSIIGDELILNYTSYIAYHFGEGWQEYDPIVSKTYTFSLTDTILKVSTSSKDSDDYNPSECNIFIKAR